MLFSRYAGASEIIMNYDFELGLEIINKAYEQKAEEDAYQRWLLGYEREMSFHEFKNKLIDSIGSFEKGEKTEKEIFEKVKEILNMRRG